ncbi:MAG TPA: 16S rRNA (guanine(966)-N(2))-methyltransferase RsmD [Longimicrobiales bacterium]|nr:16S rRNA (guanine(966)-N(2))-methyltransferase RsmD [Longimicrobiales bacterium]
MRIIAGEWRGRRLSPVRTREVRPTTDRVREAWMSALGGRFDGQRALDLFAGSGALGLELLSRGAAHVTFVERARGSLDVLRRNVALVGAGERATVVAADVFSWLDRRTSDAPGLPHLALADPPYGTGLAERLVDRFRTEPFAECLWVEHATAEPLPDVEGLRQRRYGDTTLSSLSREP